MCTCTSTVDPPLATGNAFAERMLRAEEKAGRLPATMTVPMMLFILPALFIVLIGPAILDIMDNFIGMGQ